MRTFIEIIMEKKTKKTLKKVFLWGAVLAAAGVAGYGAYKKIPMVKNHVDFTAGKIKGLVDGFKKKSPEAVTVNKPNPVYVNNHGVVYKKK